MDFNEAELLQRANQGDVSAMVQLVVFYGNGNNFIDAGEWADKAADTGNLDGYRLSISTNKINALTMTGLGDLDAAKKYWQIVYNRSNTLQSLYSKGQIELTSEFQQLVVDSIEESRVGVAQILYFEEGDGNQYHADIATLLKGINSSEALALAGIIYKDLEDYGTSFSILNVVFQDREYAALAGKSNPEQRIYEIACLNLSIYYRVGVPGVVQQNFEMAKSILESSMQYVTSDWGKNTFQQELSHYKKKLFGGYKYE